ncbi:MAG: sugar ABC transporter substrate-binding protein [Mycobacteriales bacterium]
MRRSFSYQSRVLGAVTAALLLLGTAACGKDSNDKKAAPAGTAAGGAFNWQKHDGKTLTLMFSKHPWSDAITPLLGDFTAKTGIKTKVESLPEAQFRQRVQVEMTGKSDVIDVFMTAGQNEGAKFAKNGWYEPLDGYLADTSKVAPDYAAADLSPGVLTGLTFGKKLTALPISLEVEMLYYNKRLFKDAGVSVPTTYDELLDVAAKLDNKGGARAIALRGKGAASVTQFSAFLFGQGATWTEQSGKAAFATPEGVKAFETYGKLAREYGPPGAINRSWEEGLPMFQQGQVAMWIDAGAFMPKVMDKAASKVVEDVGFAPMPTGPGGAVQAYNGWGIGMSPFSKNKDAAWYFMQWATSPEIVGKITEAGIPGGRTSATFGPRFPADWVQTYTKAIGEARPQLPAVVSVGESRDAIGAAVVAAIEGKPVEPAVKKAETEFNRIVETAGG